MLKPVIAATALLAIAGSSYVYAQQRFDGPQGFRDGGPRVEYRHRLSVEDVSALADARIAALKAGLELTADQQKNWPAFETALRNMVALRIDRIKARQAEVQPPQGSPFDRMARRADNMNKASAALKQIADAGAPLYMSLDDSQKARFTMLSHMLRPHHHMQGGWRDGRGFDRDGRGGGPGWRRDGNRFGDNDGPNGGMHRMMDRDGDQDSRL
jgi:zinc resistance-associated protein